MMKPTMSSLRRKPPARQPMPPAYFPAIPSPREPSAPTSPTRPSNPTTASANPDLQGAYLAAYAAASGAAAATRTGRGYVHTGGYAEPPTPAPVILQQPTPVSRRRIVVAAVAVAGFVLVAVALVVLPPLRHSGMSDTVNTAQSGRRATATLASLPAGVSVPADGSYTRTRALASGDLHVDQWIRSRAELSRITLSVPSAPGITAGTVRASHVLVSGSSGSSRTPSSVGPAAETYRFTATHAVHLSYDLSGAVERSSSSTGRALARVVALDISYPGRRGPSTTSVVGARVLTLACSAPRADAVPRPCGEPDASSWTVQLDGPNRSDRVLAQLDLG